MNITYHLLDVEWRSIVDLLEYEPYIRYVASGFPMITKLAVLEKYFTISLNTTDSRVKNGVIRAFFTQLAQTPLQKYGYLKNGTFKVFIENKNPSTVLNRSKPKKLGK